MSDMGEILGTPPAGDDNPEGFVSNDQSEDRAGGRRCLDGHGSGSGHRA